APGKRRNGARTPTRSASEGVRGPALAGASGRCREKILRTYKDVLMSRSTPSILILMLLAGCGGSGSEQESSNDDPSANRVLTSADLDRFLKIVEIHEG